MSADARLTPGTVYTREGPEQDPAGRLADFARFAERELGEILEALDHGAPNTAIPPGTHHDATRMLAAADSIAGRMSGYTTAADSEPSAGAST